MKKKICIFISDEGYGHIVRQVNIINKLLKKKKFHITVITSSKIQILKEKFGNQISYDNFDNNIQTVKNKNGSLNINDTKKKFFNWKTKSKKWIDRNLKKYRNQNLYISDFVPDAFLLGELNKIPCIGIAHFTWDWFYKKIYKKNDDIYKYLTYLIKKSSKLYFPPFTPKYILKKYKKKIKNINFIVSDFDIVKINTNKIRVLIMDNGAENLKNLIKKTIPYLPNIKKFEFIIRTDNLDKKLKKIIIKSQNIVPVTGLKNMHSQIYATDIVIARGGFNTITECLSLKKPSILFNEKNNPEVFENIENIKKKKLGKLINLEDWGVNFEKKINSFYQKDFKIIKKKLMNSSFKKDGPEQIAYEISKILKNRV